MTEEKHSSVAGVIIERRRAPAKKRKRKMAAAKPSGKTEGAGAGGMDG